MTEIFYHFTVVPRGLCGVGFAPWHLSQDLHKQPPAQACTGLGQVGREASHVSCEETFCSSGGFRLNGLSSRFEALTPACFQLSQWAGWWDNHLLQAEEQHLSGSARALTAASPISPSGPGWWSHPFPGRSGPALRSSPPCLLWSPSPVCTDSHRIKALTRRAYKSYVHFLSLTTAELQKTTGQAGRSLPTGCPLIAELHE